MTATNVNIANFNFEEIFCNILNMEAPMGIVQSRTKYNSWITDETKVLLLERDNARLKAKMTDDVNDWEIYRQMRNNCTARQRKDRKKQRKEVFDKIETENDSAKLFNTVKTLMGVKNVGPPTCLKAGGLAKFKQIEIAETQSAYYCDMAIGSAKSTYTYIHTYAVIMNLLSRLHSKMALISN